MKRIEDEYLRIDFIEDSECLVCLKETIMGLPLPDRNIMLMYIEEGTYSAVAKRLKCSVPTVSKKIRKIREEIKIKIKPKCNDQKGIK